jgi:hypothetical protein
MCTRYYFINTLDHHNPNLRAQSECHSVTIDDDNLYLDDVYCSYKENTIWQAIKSEGKLTYSCTPPLTLVLDGGGWSMPYPAILHLARYPVPIVQKAGWDPELFWIGMENFVQTGDSTPDCSAHSITS